MTSIQSSSLPDARIDLAPYAAAPVALSTEEQLLALLVYSQACQMKDARQTVDFNAEQLEKLHEQVQKALAEAREAKKDAGFWGGLGKLLGGDLATLAGAVAAVAAVVATGGGAAAVLAVVASAASFAAEHAEELGIPMEVSMAIAIGASVAALCCGNVGRLFDVSAKTAEVADKVKTWATVAQYSFEAGGVVCNDRAASFEHDVAYARADARYADGQQQLVNIDLDEALDRFSTALERQLSAIEQTSSIQQQSAAANHAVLGNWGGAA